MYCPECGTRLEEGELFCPECGTKVEMEDLSSAGAAMSSGPSFATPVSSSYGNREDECHVPVAARGLILTNIRTLSKRLGVNADGLREVLDLYIKHMRTLGVRYVLLDAGDYTYQRKPKFGKPKHVSLGPSDPWHAYADILLDWHEEEMRTGQTESDYLFIIGGEMDVPMARVRNFVDNNNDSTLDTDLLYAYPYGPDMAEKLQNQELFKYDALFYVGRLPIALDGSIEDLTGYLQNVLDNGCSVPLGYAYVQCDPHWQQVTAEITKDLSECGMVPEYAPGVPPTILSKDNILLTPHVVCDSRSRTHPRFNKDAAYYFFNMHGSDVREACGFSGEGLHNEGWATGMSPTLISQASRPNLLFTQACYGGRFINYRKRESTVLTALASNTLAYVGSSRTAVGTVDGGMLMGSDILGLVYNGCMLSGGTAGASFFQARIATFKSNPGHPYSAMTITEFNLFGDPLVHLRLNDKSVDYTGDKHAVLAKDAQVAPIRTEVLMQKSAGNQSLLSQVRQAVDNNIMAISAAIAKTLYAQYGVEAREPSVISRYSYADGHKELSFVYLRSAPDGIRNEVHVQSSEKGDILQVSATK